ncbi:MAG: hypothetical protein EOO38_01425 [Cytophagaceae bacterium]|nr:MAG: hypothetical protein EOO38_01425 [Cytophagaceae bacterium]
MTEQKAEDLAARLTRLWKPKNEPRWGVDGAYFGYQCYIEDNIFVEFATLSKPQITSTALKQYLNGRLQMGYLYYRDGELRVIDTDDDQVDDFDAFVNLWGDTFRRNCFLMGCNVEASAHEKAEWIQGFSREELEAWNLKI